MLMCAIVHCAGSARWAGPGPCDAPNARGVECDARRSWQAAAAQLSLLEARATQTGGVQVGKCFASWCLIVFAGFFHVECDARRSRQAAAAQPGRLEARATQTGGVQVGETFTS
jgi:hypothetical protein